MAVYLATRREVNTQAPQLSHGREAALKKGKRKPEKPASPPHRCILGHACPGKKLFPGHVPLGHVRHAHRRTGRRSHIFHSWGLRCALFRVAVVGWSRSSWARPSEPAACRRVAPRARSRLSSACVPAASSSAVAQLRSSQPHGVKVQAHLSFLGHLTRARRRATQRVWPEVSTPVAIHCRTIHARSSLPWRPQSCKRIARRRN